MKTTARILCAISLLFFLAPSPSSLAQSTASKPKPGLRAGAATSNITPAIGGAIIGGFHPFPSTHIHDELHARCLVLDNGETRIALVVLDLLGIGREVSDEARKLVEKQTGIPATNVLISATHTHSAVSALGTNRFLINQPLDEYQRFVAQRIADGVQRAANQLEPARIGWAVDEEPRQVFNRRWFMKPGTVPVNPFGEFDQVKMNPPRASKDLDKPAGPTDPQVTVLAVQSLDGRPIGAYASYSLHYVGGVGNGHISADYYGMFCARFAELLNPPKADAPFVAMLGNGTSGNINNIDFSKSAVSQPPYTKMREVAEDVAQAALRAWKKIQWQDTVKLGAQFREFTVGTRRVTPAQIDRAKEILARPRTIPRPDTLEEIYAQRTLGMADYPATISIPLQAFRIGDMSFGSMPNEVFVETGLEFKQRTPFKPGVLVSIAHGYYGYLPTPEHHKLGGYETWLGTNRFEPEASTKMLGALIEMLGKL